MTVVHSIHPFPAETKRTPPRLRTGVPALHFLKLVEKYADEFKKQYREHIGMRVDD